MYVTFSDILSLIDHGNKLISETLHFLVNEFPFLQKLLKFICLEFLNIHELPCRIIRLILYLMLDFIGLYRCRLYQPLSVDCGFISSIPQLAWDQKAWLLLLLYSFSCKVAVMHTYIFFWHFLCHP
jgi:hypothetical protein